MEHKYIIVATLVSIAGVASAATPIAKPNILFCLADDVSYPFWGAYGCSWVRTPNIDRVANDGLLFSNAYTPNAKSGPSRSCILTGRNSWQLGALGNHFAFWDDRFVSFAEVLEQCGYDVASTGKGWAPGDPGLKDGKRRELIGKTYNNHKLTPHTDGISPIDYAKNFDEFLASRDSSLPFFFWYGGLEPHRAYQYGSGVEVGGYSVESIDKIPPYWEDCHATRNDMLDFALELEHFDNHLGMMIESLDREGLLSNTLIVVTADNGMPFPRIKGQAYESSNHLPMAVMWLDGVKNRGDICDKFVSFIDLAPTFLDFAGVNGEEYGMPQIEGKSIKSIIEGNKCSDSQHPRDFVLIGKERHDIGRPNDEGYPIRGIVTSKYLYINNFEPSRFPAGNPETGYLNCDAGAIKSHLIEHRFDPEGSKLWQLCFGIRPQEELYDIECDPNCIDNLAYTSEFIQVKKQLRTKLLSELKSQGDPRMDGRDSEFDSYPYCNDAHRDYYNRLQRGEELPFPGWITPSDVDKR